MVRVRRAARHLCGGGGRGSVGLSSALTARRRRGGRLAAKSCGGRPRGAGPRPRAAPASGPSAAVVWHSGPGARPPDFEVRRAAGSVMASAVGWGWGSSRLDGVVLPWHSPPPAAVGGREGNGGVDHRHGGGGGRRPPSSGTGQHFAALLRAAVARSLTLSTALAGLDGGDAAACWRIR